MEETGENHRPANCPGNLSSQNVILVELVNYQACFPITKNASRG